MDWKTPDRRSRDAVAGGQPRSGTAHTDEQGESGAKGRRGRAKGVFAAGRNTAPSPRRCADSHLRRTKRPLPPRPQRSRRGRTQLHRRLVGGEHFFCLCKLDAHGRMSRAALGGASGHDALQVERARDVGLEQLALGFEVGERKIAEAAAALLAHKHEMPHHLVGAPERQPLLRQVVGHVGGCKVALLRLGAHGLGHHAHRLDHAGGAHKAVLERPRGVDGALLVLLQVLVVRKRQGLARDEQRYEVAHHAPGLAADELGEVRVLLLRHDGRARGERIGQLDEPELGAGPQHDLLAQTRQVHARHAARVRQIEQKVAVGHGVERVRDDAREAQVGSRHLPIERVRGARERRRAERARVGGATRSNQALEIAREHPRVGQQMMRQQHRLGVLQVRAAGEDDVEVRFGLHHERAAQREVGPHEVGAALLGEQARVGGHLVVAAAPRVQSRARIAHALDERAFHRHVDVLVIHIEGEPPRLDIRFDAVEAGCDGVGILLRDDALRRQHARMRLGTRDVLRVQRLVHRQRRSEALRERIRSLGEPARPQCHAAPPLRLIGRDGVPLGRRALGCGHLLPDGRHALVFAPLERAGLLLGIEQLRGRALLPTVGSPGLSGERLQLYEALGGGVVERVVRIVGGQRIVVERVRALAADHRARALVELEPHRSRQAALRVEQKRVKRLLERREPLPVVHARRPCLLDAQLVMQHFALEHQILERLVRHDEGERRGGLVALAALHAHEPVLDHVEAAVAVRAGDLVQGVDDAEEAFLVAVDHIGQAAGRT